MEKVLKLWRKQRIINCILCDPWSNYFSSSLRHLECIYVTTKKKCLFSSATIRTDHLLTQEVPQLECDHEEADTRLLLHYKAAADTHQRIIIKTLVVLCIAMQKTVGKELFKMTGTGNKFCLIDVSLVSNVLGEELTLCACLPGFHAFSGIICR